MDYKLKSKIETMEEIKWLSVDNARFTSSLKQHGYKQVESIKSYGEINYIGNQALCSTMFITEDGEYPQPFEDIDNYAKKPEIGCCKKCLKIYNKLTP